MKRELRRYAVQRYKDGLPVRVLEAKDIPVYGERVVWAFSETMARMLVRRGRGSPANVVVLA